MKVTLDIDPRLAGEIENIAKRRKVSLSELASFLFKKEVSDDVKAISISDDVEIADWVKRLTFSKQPIQDFDHKAEYRKHIEEKYDS